MKRTRNHQVLVLNVHNNRICILDRGAELTLEMEVMVN